MLEFPSAQTKPVGHFSPIKAQCHFLTFISLLAQHVHVLSGVHNPSGELNGATAPVLQFVSLKHSTQPLVFPLTKHFGFEASHWPHVDPQ
jgi:hypothetical protein